MSSRSPDSPLANPAKITEALAQLAKIDGVKKLAGSIQNSAIKIDSECTGLSSGIRRLLDQAMAALAGTGTADESGSRLLEHGAA